MKNTPKPLVWLGARIAVGCVLATFCAAQEPASQGQQPSEPTPSPRPDATRREQKSEHEKEIERKEQSQRILGVMPQFGMTSRQDAPPLSPGEKFHLFAKSAFDPVIIATVGLQAGLSQGQNEFPAYGQGAEGYGKRFGAAFADEVSAGFWSNYAFPVLLKEDPRYFRLGEGAFRTRFFYAVKQEFVCHTDKGGRSFNFSGILGAFAGGAVSNLYYPGRTEVQVGGTTKVYASERGVGLTASRAGIAIGYGILGSLVDEFWPDISRKLFKSKAKSEPIPGGNDSR
ncbi:MAG TPA: hypothetical protein VGS27_24880 [Candidatus Sulfotelmatobacter sp.]|nr:hypothetical protein [Candidatus Sulfotelmatobacter sp.]